MFNTRRIVRTGATAAIFAACASVAWGSSHREAPGITEQPKIDATDFYMFRSYEEGRQQYVTFIANYQPDQSPYGGPNYYTMDPDALYEIMIDNDGDAVEDITFQFDFNNILSGGTGIQLPIGDEMVSIPLRQAGAITRASPIPALGERESYTVTMITGDRRSGDAAPLSHPRENSQLFFKPVDNIGEKTLPDYEAYANSYIYSNVTIPGCEAEGRVFVGQRAEAFAVNLGGIFDLVNFVPIEGDSAPGAGDGQGFPGGITQDRANDDLVGIANVTSLAIEVPIACITDGDAVIGAWTTSSLPQGQVEDPSPTYAATSAFGGAWVQQSRLSAPLVNEVVIGLPDKDLFNAAEPTQDAAVAVYVTNPTLPALLDLLFRDAVGSTENIAPSNFPRNDLVAAFLTGLPGLNASSNPNAAVAEMMRLNTAIPPTPREDQSTFGVVAEDLAGFPNGRRPGDDTVDIALRVVMGALCYALPLATELGVPGAVEDSDSDFVNLGYCNRDAAPVGQVAFTDGAPIAATELQAVFPYLNAPLSGSGS